MTRQRLFVACDLPVDIKTRLEYLQKILQKSGCDTKWVEPYNIHLTLKFLGDTPSDKTKDIGKLIDKLFAARKKLLVTLDQLDAFPSRQAPRIIWAGLKDDGSMKKMSLLLNDALSDMGFSKESRAFQAHVTMGRVRSGRNRVALTEMLMQTSEELKEEIFRIDNVTLFESRLGSGGPEYSVLHQIKLC